MPHDGHQGGKYTIDDCEYKEVEKRKEPCQKRYGQAKKWMGKHLQRTEGENERNKETDMD